MKALEYRGQFWLPDTPNRKLSGILEFHPDTGARLSLIDELVDPFGEPTVDPTNIRRILGVRTNGMGLTLENCFQTRAQFGLGSLGEQTYAVGMIFEPVHYDNDDQPEFDRVIVGMRHLCDWTAISSIRERVPLRKGKGRSRAKVFSVSGHSLPPMSATVAPGVTVAFAHRVRLVGDSNQRSLAQSVSLDVRVPAPLPLATLGRYPSSVQNLVSICTDRVAEFEAFQLYHPDLTQMRPSMSGPVEVPEPISLHVEWLPRDGSEKPHRPHESIVPFETLGGMDGVATWVRTELKFEDHVARVMATRYAKTMFADDRLFNRTAALEGLHRSITKRNPTFAKKLNELAEMAGDPFTRLVSEIPKWVKRMKDERNDHAHHLGNAANTTGATRYYLAESAYWLFVVCMFRQCGYTDAVFDAVERSRAVTWVRDRMVGLLA